MTTSPKSSLVMRLALLLSLRNYPMFQLVGSILHAPICKFPNWSTWSYAYHSTGPLHTRGYHPDVQDLGVELSHYCLQPECSIFGWDQVWRLSDNYYGHVDVGLLLVHFEGKGWFIVFLATLYSSWQSLTIASRETFTGTSLGKYLQSICPLVRTSTICPSHCFFGLYHQSLPHLWNVGWFSSVQSQKSSLTPK